MVGYSVGPFPDPASAADLNGDGKLNLFTAGEDSGDVSVLLNKGDPPSLVLPAPVEENGWVL